MSEEVKAPVLPFSGQQVDWDEWSERYQGIAAERGYIKIMLGMEHVPTDALDIGLFPEVCIYLHYISFAFAFHLHFA